MFKWIKSYTHNRRARVAIDNNRSKKILLRCGVPQGRDLSPTFFIVFMNDLVKPLTTFIKSAMYADDLVMLQLLKYGFKQQSTYFQIGQMSGACRLTETKHSLRDLHCQPK